MITEREISNKLQMGVTLRPMTFRLIDKNPRLSEIPTIQPDALVEGTLGNQSFIFAVEINRYISPKTVSQAIYSAKQAARSCLPLLSNNRSNQEKVYPLIITPWLSPENLNLLEEESVSGIDLSGNGVVVIPNSIFVRRDGQPNAYPDSRLVRNVYSGNTSLVARVFLRRPHFTSVNDIVQEINNRNGAITQPTVSKALQQLQEDLVVRKEKADIRLVQPNKLLDRLSSEFSMPKVRQSIQFQTTDGAIGETLADAARLTGTKIALTGSSSVDLVTAFAREPLVSFYSSGPLSNIVKALKEPPELNSRFPNVRLIETEDPTVYFDTKYKNGVFVPSIVQTWLELNAGDGRQKEASVKVRQLILDNIAMQ